MNDVMEFQDSFSLLDSDHFSHFYFSDDYFYPWNILCFGENMQLTQSFFQFFQVCLKFKFFSKLAVIY